MKFHISVKNFFKVSDALLDWDKINTQLIAQVNRYYIQSVQNIGKIDQTRMPKLVCFNAARTIYEELAKQKLPELEADLIIRGLNKNDTNSGDANFVYSTRKQPEEENYDFGITDWKNQALIISLLWAIFAIEDNPNQQLLKILENACKNDNPSIHIFEEFRQLTNKIFEERKKSKQIVNGAIDLSKMQTQPEPPVKEPPHPKYIIAKKRKTDVIKLFFFMQKLGLFAEADGKPIRKEKDFMEAVGSFFGENFSQYLQYNSKAKNMNTYMNVFADLRDMAKDDKVIRQLQDLANEYVLAN